MLQPSNAACEFSGSLLHSRSSRLFVLSRKRMYAFKFQLKIGLPKVKEVRHCCGSRANVPILKLTDKKVKHIYKQEWYGKEQSDLRIERSWPNPIPLKHARKWRKDKFTKSKAIFSELMDDTLTFPSPAPI